MRDTTYLDWPFFEPRHRELATSLDDWAAAHVEQHHTADIDAQCRALVRSLGAAGWLRHAVGGTAFGGAADAIDTRAICVIRETLARHAGLADFAFAMQGLGSGAISLAGSDEQKRRWLPAVARGEAIAAFALSEPQAGSDVAAMQCSARIDGEHAVLDGEKTWISNGGIADFYVVFARGEEPGDQDGRTGSRPFASADVDEGVQDRHCLQGCGDPDPQRPTAALQPVDQCGHEQRLNIAGRRRPDQKAPEQERKRQRSEPAPP